MLECSFVKQLEAFPLEVDFRAENETVALLGASGSGKSMTLKCIAGVQRPTAAVLCSTGGYCLTPMRALICRRRCAGSDCCFRTMHFSRP